MLVVVFGMVVEVLGMVVVELGMVVVGKRETPEKVESSLENQTD
jgi:hypothetical protein